MNREKKEQPKRMDIKEFRAFGFIQEINRQFLHPMGLAIEVIIDEKGNETLGGIWDYRDDPKGITYAKEIMATKIAKEKADRVQEFKREKHMSRKKALGFVIQPIKNDRE